MLTLFELNGLAERLMGVDELRVQKVDLIRVFVSRKEQELTRIQSCQAKVAAVIRGCPAVQIPTLTDGTMMT